MRLSNIYIKHLSILLMVLQIIMCGAPYSLGLGVQPFTSSLSTEQQLINLVKTFILSQLSEIPGYQDKTLSREDFHPQTLFIDNDPGKSKRITVSKVDPAASGEYTVICLVGDIPFRARIDLSGDDVTILVEKIDISDFRFFPVVRKTSSNRLLLPDISHELIILADTVYQNLVMSEVIVRKPENEQIIFDFIKKFTELNKIKKTTKWLSPIYSNYIISQKYKDPSFKASGKNTAMIFNLLGQYFYFLKPDKNMPYTASLAEWYFRIARNMDKDEFNYHYSWLQALSHCKDNENDDLIMEECEKLLKRNLDRYQNERVRILMGYTRLKLVARERKKFTGQLERNDAAAEETYLKLLEGLNAIIDSLRLFNDKEQKPRGRSLVGAAFTQRAGLNLTALEHLDPSGNIKALSLDAFQIFKDIHTGVQNLETAMKASTSPGQWQHARNMLLDYLSDAIGSVLIPWLEKFHEKLQDHNLTEKLFYLQKVVHEVLESIDKNNLNTRDSRTYTTLMRSKRKLDEILAPLYFDLIPYNIERDLYPKIKQLIIRRLSKIDLSALDDAVALATIRETERYIESYISEKELVSRYFAGLSEDLRNTTCALLIEKCDKMVSAFTTVTLRDAITRPLDLAIINAFKELPPNQLTARKIHRSAGLLLGEDIQKDVFDSRLQSLSSLFNVSIMPSFHILFDIDKIDPDQMNDFPVEAQKLQSNDHTFLMDLATDANPVVRLHAVNKLGRMMTGFQNSGAEEDAVKADEISAILEVVYEDDPSWKARYAALFYLYRYDQKSYEYLMNAYELFNRQDIEISTDFLNAADSKSSALTEKDLQEISTLSLSDTDDSIRLRAVNVLGGLLIKKAVPGLRKILMEDDSAEVRKNAASALANISPASTPDLKKSVYDDRHSFPGRLRLMEIRSKNIFDWSDELLSDSFIDIVLFFEKIQDLNDLLFGVGDHYDTADTESYYYRALNTGSSLHQRKDITTDYHILESEITRLEKDLEEYISVIKRHIKSQTEDIRTTVEKIYSDCRKYDLEISWIAPLLDSLKNTRAQMDSLLEFDEELALSTDEISHDYLSYPEFTRLNTRMESDRIFERIGSSVDTLKGYRTALKNIGAFQKTASELDAFLGKNDTGRSYLEDLRKTLLKNALSGIPFGASGTDYDRLCNDDIPRRNVLLHNIKVHLEMSRRKIEDFFDKSGFRGAGVNNKDIRRARKAALQGVKSELYIPEIQVAVYEWLVEPDNAFPQPLENIFWDVFAKKTDLVCTVQRTKLLFGLYREYVLELHSQLPEHLLAEIDQIRSGMDALSYSLANNALLNDLDPSMDRLSIEDIREKTDANVKAVIEDHESMEKRIRSLKAKIIFYASVQELRVLKDFTMTWAKNWGIKNRNYKAIMSNFNELILALDASDPEHVDEAVRQAFERSYATFLNMFDRYSKTYFFDAEFQESHTLMKIAKKLTKIVKGASYTLRYIKIPTLDPEGAVIDIFSMAFPKEPYGSHMFSFSTASDEAKFVINPENSPKRGPNRFILSMLRSKHIESQELHNKMLQPVNDDFQGIRMRPDLCVRLIHSSLLSYEELFLSNDPDKYLENTDHLSLSRVFQRIINKRELLDDQYVPLYRIDDTIRILREQPGLYKSGGLKPGIKMFEKALPIAIKFRESVSFSTRSGLNDRALKIFHKNVSALLDKVQGKDQTSPAPSETDLRTILTLPANAEGEVNLFDLYPPSDKFGGLYFDPVKRSFGLLLTKRLNKDSRKLRRAFEIAFSAYSALINRQDAAAEVHKELFKQIQSKEAVNIAVVKNLPTNSLFTGSTLVFDEKFIEFIIKYLEPYASDEQLLLSETDDIAASIILAERIFHELGHMALKGLDMIALDEEVEQLEKDLVFYKAVFSGDKGLDDKMESFTDTMVDTPEGEKKFSHIFNTKRLFKKMKEWSKSYDKKKRSVKMDMKSFAKAELSRISLIPSDSRLFPAINDKDALSDAKRSADTLKDFDIALLNNIHGRESAFFEKTRRILISASLIPKCQRGLIRQINKRSELAFESGWTRDLIEIRPLTYIQNVRAEDNVDSIVLLEKNADALIYQRKEKEARLIFERTGDSPVQITGLIAAARSVLYKDMETLKNVLRELSADKDMSFPTDSDLIRLLNENKEEFARILAIKLPDLLIASEHIQQFNETALYLIQFA